MNDEIPGQLSDGERALLAKSLTPAGGERAPEYLLEVGTWLGGGSTLHILRALQHNQAGHLWGIEYSREIHDQMIANLKKAIPEALDRFTPIFGSSELVIPQWIKSLPNPPRVDFAFLDGGDNPNEQILEFQLLDPHMPVGSQLMAHDARVRKGKWLVPYLSALDHWKVELHDLSEVGMLHATKVAQSPSEGSREAAEALLRKLKRETRELLIRLMPDRLRAAIARILPNRIMHLLLHGTQKSRN